MVTGTRAATPRRIPARGGRGPRLGVGLALLLAGIAAARAQPVEPSAARAVGLVRGHRTAGYVTVAQTLAFAEQVRPRGFRMDRIWVERRADEPFTRVHLCYRLRPPGRPAESACGIDYLVSADPPHVEVAEAQSGLGRDLEAGRAHFVRGLDRELALRRDPAAAALRRALDPFDPYDPR